MSAILKTLEANRKKTKAYIQPNLGDGREIIYLYNNMAVEALDEPGIRHSYHQLDILEALAKNGYGKWKEDDRCRLFSSHSFANIKKEVRAALLKGLPYVDIRQCYLSLAPTVWNSPQLAQEANINIWDSLQCTPTEKEFSKVGLYSIMFGSVHWRNDLKGQISTTAFDRFNNHTTIKALLKARDSHMKAIKNGTHKPFNYWRNEPFNVPVKTNKDIRSAMSLEIQSLERLIMEKWYEKLLPSQTTHILTYEFDGYTYMGHDQTVIRVAFEDALNEINEQYQFNVPLNVGIAFGVH